MEENLDIGRVISLGFGTAFAIAKIWLPLALLFVAVPAVLAQVELFGKALAYRDQYSSLPRAAATLALGALGIWMKGAAVAAALDRLQGGAGSPRALLAAARSILPLIGITLAVGIGASFAMLLLIVPGVILYLAMSVSIPVLMAERSGVGASLNRSGELTRGQRWRILAVLLVLAIVDILLNAAAETVFALRQGFAVQAAAQSVSEAATTILHGGVLAALFVELRRLKEGEPVSELAEVFA